MKKKYYVVLISFAVLLIVSMIAIGILNYKLVKDKNKDKFYNIGEEKIYSINYVCNENLEIDGYNFTTNNSVFTKAYTFKTNDGKVIVEAYMDYLLNEEDFALTFQADETFDLSKTLENEDVFNIELSYSSTQITLTLTYTKV